MKRWYLDQDESCHWYLIPEEKREAFQKWNNLPAEDEIGWVTPDYAIRVGSPSHITFTDPKV